MKELKARVGSFLGWGRGADYGDRAWSDQEQFEIDGIVGSGLRKFYRPVPLPNESSSYEWSFLKPVASLTLASGASTVALPDDYGGVEGQIAVSTSGSTAWLPVDFGPIGDVYNAEAQYPTTTGRPLMACVEPIKGTTAKKGQHSQLRIWPIADQAYTLRFPYYVNGNVLTTANPYPLGGAQHAETVLESCLAVAEKRLDNNATVHTMEFMQQLAASISVDRQQKPQVYGYNGDMSMYRRQRYGPAAGRMWDFPGVKVNGVQF